MPASTTSGISGKCARKARRPKRLFRPFARTDRRAPRHQHLAPRLDQPLGDDQIFGHVRKDRETVVAQNPRRFDKAENIRLQRVGVADHFELDPIRSRIFRAPFAPS